MLIVPTFSWLADYIKTSTMARSTMQHSTPHCTAPRMPVLPDSESGHPSNSFGGTETFSTGAGVLEAREVARVCAGVLEGREVVEVVRVGAGVLEVEDSGLQ